MNCFKVFLCVGIIILSCQAANADQKADSARARLEADYQAGKISRADYEQVKKIFESHQKSYDQTQKKR